MLGVALMITNIIFAQQSKTPQDIAIRQTEKMKSVLLLSETQYATIKSINENYAGKFAAISKAEESKKEEQHSAKKDLRLQKEKEVNAVLTPEQQEKWKSYKHEKKVTSKKHKGDRKGHPKNNIKETLGLSGDQANRLEEIRKGFKEKRDAIKNDKTLSEDQIKIKLESLKSEHELAVKTILSEEQFKKWNELRADRKAKGSPKRKK
jgi:Spy/CpxP family protein refolding chaperone